MFKDINIFSLQYRIWYIPIIDIQAFRNAQIPYVNNQNHFVCSKFDGNGVYRKRCVGKPRMKVRWNRLRPFTTYILNSIYTPKVHCYAWDSSVVL